MIEPVLPSETETLLHIASATGIFEPGEVEILLGGTLEKLHSGELSEDHHALAYRSEGKPLGWVYFSPEAEKVWQLWWIGVDHESQGKGVGTELLKHVERHLQAQEARILLIETSSADKFQGTRNFYAKHGYAECGSIPDYYGLGESKVLFVKKFV